MDRNLFIRTLGNLVSEASYWTDEQFKERIKRNSIVFNNYSTGLVVTFKLEKPMKKPTALQKARSQLKKAEHVKTPLSIKRKIKKKEK